MRISIHFILILLNLAILQFSASAQWDWEVDETKVAKERDTLSEDFNPQRLYEYIMTDIQELDNPHWHKAYANEVCTYPKSLEAGRKIVKGWTFWEEQLEKMANEFSPYTSFNRDHLILITEDGDANAFAMEGGLIMVTVGMLADIESMDELRLALAHEMGHVHKHHPFHGYARYRKMQNQQTTGMIVGAVIGGVAGAVVSHAIAKNAFSSAMEHSRDQESEADEFAGRVIANGGYSVKNGVGCYEKFYMQRMRYKYKTGYDPTAYAWASSHPAPQERKAHLLGLYGDDKVKQYSEPEGFAKYRNVARLTKLDILLREENYRDVLEYGWHYLIDDPENSAIQEKMLEALNRLKKESEVDFFNGMVLTYDYLVSEVTEGLIAKDDLNSSASKSYVMTMLLMSRDDFQSPFPIGVTFSEMEALIKLDLNLFNETETIFWKAITADELDKEKLKEYLAKQGKYAAYVKNILNPNQAVLDKVIAIPMNMSLEASYHYPRKEFDDCYNMTNWAPLTKRLSKTYPDIELVQLSDEERLELMPLSNLSKWKNGQHRSTVDFMQMDPVLVDYILRNNAQKLLIFDYKQTKRGLKVQVHSLDIVNQRLTHGCYGMSVKYLLKPKTISMRMKKVYNRLS